MSILRRLYFLSTILVASFPIWPLRWTTFFITSWGFLAIANAIVNRRERWMSDLWPCLIFSGLYVFYFLTWFLFDDPEITMKHMERRLSLVVFPLGFYLYTPAFDKVQKKRITMVFEYAAVLLTIYLAIDITPYLLSEENIFEIENQFSWVFRTQMEQRASIHPTYLSIILLFSVFLKIDRLLSSGPSVKQSVLIFECLQILLLVSCCLLLSARGPLLAFFAGILFYFIHLNWKRTIIGIVVGLPILLFMFSSVPAISERFKELKEVGKSVDENETLNSATIRQAIWRCSFEALKENWLWGIGLAHTQDRLNQCYEQYRDKTMRQLEFNTHNQYIDIWISAGIIGFLLFLFSLFYAMALAYKRKDKQYTFFLIIVCICFLTENLLARQHGVVFFAFMNALFAFRH